MRDEVRSAADALIAHGDRNLWYFDGRDLFGQSLVKDYLPDGVHPNGDGYELLGQNFLKVVLGKIPL